MKSLVTGISGFVGGFLAEHLLAAGDEVLGISPKGTLGEGWPDDLARRVPAVAWDIGQEELPAAEVLATIRDFSPDCVYHLAAISVPEDCGREAPSQIANAVNIEGTRRVLALAGSLSSKPRVLFISSSHVYAPVTEQAWLVNEDWPIQPRNGYGATKLAGEQLVALAVQSGLDVVIARAFQHTGPRQSPRMMLPEWISQYVVSPEAPIRVFNRTTYIDLSDVRDVVRAYRLLIERGACGICYNVASGERRLTGDVLEIVQRLAGKREIVETRPGRRHDPIGDISRLSGATGWRPEIPVEQTVADTLAWWRG